MRIISGHRFSSVPTVPQNVAASPVSSSQINVSWSASIDATGGTIDYLIFKDGSTGPVANTSSLSFSDTGLAPSSFHTYQIIARVVASGKNDRQSNKSTLASATTSAASGGNATITDLWVELLGQTTQGQATIGGTNNSSLFNSVDSITLAGTVQAGSFPVSGCNIYRSEDLFQTRTKLNGSLIPVTSGAFTYQDNTAVNCVANFCGGSTNPQSGAPALWWPARNYRYKVEAVDNQGNVGVLSATQKMYVYNFSSGGLNNPTINGNPAGGMKWGGDLGGGFELSYNDTGPNETGRCILVGDNGGYWLPTAGWNYPQWTKWVGGTDYFYIDINFATVNGLTLHGELNPNDHKIDLLGTAHAAPGNAPGNPSLDLTAYCKAVNGVVDNRWPNMPMSAVPAGTYCTFKVPRADYMTDAGTLQGLVYKFLINKWGGSIGNGTRFDKIFYGP